LSLFDSARGQLLNTVKIVLPAQYPEDDNNPMHLRIFPSPHVRVAAAEDIFLLPFLVTSPSYYSIPQLNSKKEGKPVILTLRDLTGQGVAAAFVLFAYQACGIASTSVIGYSQQSDTVVQYPVEVVQSGQEPIIGIWVEQIFGWDPVRPGHWDFTWDPGHAAKAKFHEQVSFDPVRQLFVDKHESDPPLRTRAEQGDADAQFELGIMYGKGEGVSTDVAQAASWFRKAADQGNASAQYSLGVMYANGDGVPKDAAQAVALYRKAADQGHARAQASLGFMYAEGEGAPKDSVQSAAWFRKAADQGNVGAQYNLGVIYANGSGVPKDAAQAVAWYRKAADQGDASAQYNLGLMYANGDGVPKDSAQAVAWFRKVADQGESRAQYSLGVMYANGSGVPRDLVTAYMWRSLAAAQGDESAKERRDNAEKYMSSAEIAEAQKLSREWKPKK
jgi:TPR repeat protein